MPGRARRCELAACDDVGQIDEAAWACRCSGSRAVLEMQRSSVAGTGRRRARRDAARRWLDEGRPVGRVNCTTDDSRASTIRGIDATALRGGLFQHGARDAAPNCAQALEVVDDAARAVGILIAVLLVAFRLSTRSRGSNRPRARRRGSGRGWCGCPDPSRNGGR